MADGTSAEALSTAVHRSIKSPEIERVSRIRPSTVFHR
jgi:hypothetical protein